MACKFINYVPVLHKLKHRKVVLDVYREQFAYRLHFVTSVGEIRGGASVQ
jgi:hypothetical protein